MFSIIVAADENNGIGKNNTLPWNLKGDMKYFKTITTKVFSDKEMNAVIMGRNTWESIPEKYRPLPNRINVVLSTQLGFIRQLPLNENIIHSNGLNAALKYINSIHNINETFVIGGASLYREALTHPDLQTVYLTRIHNKFDCDTYIPELPNDLCLVSQDNHTEDGIDYTFEIYNKIGCCM